MNSSEVRVEITSNVAQLNRALVDYAAALGKSVADVSKTAAFTLLGRIVLRTPVRTGRAAHSWHVVEYGKADAYTYTDNQGHAFNGALAESPPAPGTFLVGSNVEYMIYLENGWSQQSPQGMVRISLAEYRDAFRANIKAALAKPGRLP